MNRFRLAACAAVVILAGCGAVQPALPQNSGAPTPQLRVLSGAHRNQAGLTPADLQSAYSLPSSTKGNGQIVAIITAYDNPDVADDLAAYRSEFDLGTANFTKYNQEGQQYNYPQGSPGWGIESDASVDMVSASCPKCTIYLVEANTNAWDSLEAAVTVAVKLGAHIISNGYSGTGGDGSYFDTKGVEYLAPGGDGSEEPASFPSVVAVGGTDLSQSSGSKRGWNETLSGDSTGACVTNTKKPKWQHLKGCDYYVINQVAAAANNLAVYDSYDYGGWIEASGTALTTPLLAGVFGLAGNANKQNGGRTFWETSHHRYLYSIAAKSSQCALVVGHYNTCVGWGTPKGIGAF